MSKLFILGAGFSRAFSDSMPLMSELSEYVGGKIDELPINGNNHEVYRKLISKPGGIENLLSYISHKMPWKTPLENDMDRTVFNKLLSIVAEYISDCEEKAFGTAGQLLENLPNWAKPFAEFLHNTKPDIASLNYDTVLERMSYRYFSDTTKNIYYQIPISDLRQRSGSISGDPEPYATFHLFKLHGSINWYYTGDEDAPGQQVYYIPVTEYSPMEDCKKDPIFGRNKVDLVHLIIPPVTEKSLFYATNLIKTSWMKLRERIDEAEEIYCVGYSLPKTDLTMGLFLSTITDYNSKTIYIVNTAKDQERNRLLENYEEFFRKSSAELSRNYIDGVEKMVNSLV